MDTNIIIVLVLFIGILLGIALIAFTNTGADPKRKKILDDVEESRSLLDNDLTLRDCVIRMDTLLTKSLQVKFKNSLGCGENLKKANKLFPKSEYNKIWTYHKMRNRIVHENLEISKSEAKSAYTTFKKAITKLL
jgi:uncharacterized protein YutE (UPF0331/DUF86 family)